MRGVRGAAARLAAVAWAAGAAGSTNLNLQKNGEPKIKHFVTILMENRVRPPTPHHHPPARRPWPCARPTSPIF